MDNAKYYNLDQFDKASKIDAHIHINTADPAFLEQASLDNFILLSINTDVPGYPTLQEQQNIIINHRKRYPAGLRHVTTFETETRNQDQWHERAIKHLDESFSQGAVGVKVWKNIGMDIRDEQGDFIKIDNPLFEPIFEYLQQSNITVCGHIGEPKNCWLPLEEMTVAGDKLYFQEHPEFHMYLHPHFPAYNQLILSRDRMLERFPDLKFVGAHLGSMEWSVHEVAKRLDKYDNLAVDLAARICHLQYQSVSDWQSVYDFFIRYQDRIIYGTDLEFDGSQKPDDFREEAHNTWIADWKYFVSDGLLSTPGENYEFNGLRLPKEVIDKIYFRNALKWYPGLVF